MNDKQLVYHNDDAAERLTIGGDELAFRVTSAQTQGALVAIEVRMAAGGGPPLLHRHAPTEVYRVERGELAIYRGDGGGHVVRIAAGAGSVVAIPGGVEHTIRNESAEEATAYVVFTPGEGIEGFMRAADALAGRPEALAELAGRHGIEMTRPAPGA